MTSIESRIKSLSKFSDVPLFDFESGGVVYSCKVNYGDGKNITIKPSNVKTPIIVKLPPYKHLRDKKNSSKMDIILRSIETLWVNSKDEIIKSIQDNAPLNSFVVSGDYIN